VASGTTVQTHIERKHVASAPPRLCPQTVTTGRDAGVEMDLIESFAQRRAELAWLFATERYTGREASR